MGFLLRKDSLLEKAKPDIIPPNRRNISSLPELFQLLENRSLKKNTYPKYVIRLSRMANAAHDGARPRRPTATLQAATFNAGQGWR